MATLVHIADEKQAKRIRRSGIVPGKQSRVVYFMPVVRSYLVSHQWLRELKRGGARTLIGVYFRLPSSEPVWAGRFNESHRRMALGQAVRELSALADPLGYEIFCERKIEPGEIAAIRQLPQNIGWRYSPHAHGKPPCVCPVCLPRGSYRSRKLRLKYEPLEPTRPYEKLKEIIAGCRDSTVLRDCLWELRKKRRAADPAFLQPILAIEDSEVQEELVLTLARFKHKNAQRMLRELSGHASPAVRELAEEALDLCRPKT